MSEEAENNLTADLAEAWDEVEVADETDVSPEGDEQSSTESYETTGDLDAGGSGDSDGTDEGDLDPAGVQRPDEQNLQPESGQEQSVDSLDTPPKGLSPTAREAWKDTPEVIRKELAKREQDFEKGIMQYANDAKRAKGMDQALQPYHQFMAMNGGPQQAVPQILQTASILQMGSPVQKAEMVANIVKQFGIDIRTLDNALVGQGPPPEVQQQNETQQAVQQAIAPYQQTLQQIQAQQQYAEQQEQYQVQSEIEQFSANPKNEFYGDVRMDMAEILDMAARRGQDLSLEDAYNRACQLHPEISKIIAGRGSANEVAQRRNAASSVTGSPGGSPMGNDAADIRSTIEQAWGDSGRM